MWLVFIVISASYRLMEKTAVCALILHDIVFQKLFFSSYLVFLSQKKNIFDLRVFIRFYWNEIWITVWHNSCRNFIESHTTQSGYGECICSRQSHISDAWLGAKLKFMESLWLGWIRIWFLLCVLSEPLLAFQKPVIESLISIEIVVLNQKHQMKQ